jgi:flagellar protein FlaG
METKLAPIAQFQEPDSLPIPQPPVQPVVAPAAVEESSPDIRLMIEEDQASGLFIYKTIDRRTGTVVLQLPREEVVKMREARNYRAGGLIKTKA